MFNIFNKKSVDKDLLDRIEIDKDGIIRLNFKSKSTQKKFKEQLQKLKLLDSELMAKG